jgi:hypothetical protein
MWMAYYAVCLTVSAAGRFYGQRVIEQLRGCVKSRQDDTSDVML